MMTRFTYSYCDLDLEPDMLKSHWKLGIVTWNICVKLQENCFQTIISRLLRKQKGYSFEKFKGRELENFIFGTKHLIWYQNTL